MNLSRDQDKLISSRHETCGSSEVHIRLSAGASSIVQTTNTYHLKESGSPGGLSVQVNASTAVSALVNIPTSERWCMCSSHCINVHSVSLKSVPL